MVHTQSEAYVDGKWLWYDGLRGDHGESSAKGYKELDKDAPVDALKGKAAADVPFLEDRREFAIANFFIGERTGRVELPFVRTSAAGDAEVRSGKVVVKPRLAVRERFRQQNRGALPGSWKAEDGDWKVEDGRLWVRFSPGKPFPDLVRYVTGSPDWDDTCIEATVRRSHWGEKERGVAGLCFRSSKDAYAGVLLYDERSVRVFTAKEKRFSPVATIPFATEARRRYGMRVTCAGNRVTVAIDGKSLGSFEADLPTKGKVGALSGCDAAFDDFRIWVRGRGSIETPGVAPNKLLRWKRLIVASDPPAQNISFHWSNDQGKTWRPIPTDLDLALVSPTLSGLKIRAELTAGPDPCASTRLKRLVGEYRWSPEVMLSLPR